MATNVCVSLLNGRNFFKLETLAEFKIELFFELLEPEAEKSLMLLGNEKSSSSELACCCLILDWALTLAVRAVVAGADLSWCMIEECSRILISY